MKILKSIGRWVAWVLGTVAVVALLFYSLPQISDWLDSLLQDAGHTAHASVVFSSQLQQTRQLATSHVEEDGAFNADHISKLFNVTTQKLTVNYHYEAALGVDLTQAEVRQEGGTLYLVLPGVTVIQDSLTNKGIAYKRDLIDPLTHTRLQLLLDNQRAECRAQYQPGGAKYEQVCADAITGVQDLVEQLLKTTVTRIPVVVEFRSAAEAET